jgi:serine/threonine protein kinase
VLIALEISKAIDYAHKQSILHRDIKPENIMITHQGRVKVLDFGIAKVFKAPTITKVEKILGTTEYMAPEQILGKKLDSRADIYSLGVLIYEMVNKTLPFTGESPAALVFKKLNEKPAPFNRDDISISFKNLILKMIATLPEDRHSEIGKVIHELEQLLEESGAESGENAKDASSQPGKKINIEFLNKISPKAVYSFLTKELIPGNFITILSILLFLASLLAIYSIPGIKNPSINLNHKISDIKRIYSMLGTEENEIALLEKLYISTFGKLPPQNSSRVQYKNTLIEILKGYYGINQ